MKHIQMDKYTIIKQMGDGSYGTVFKAKENQTGKIVAIKKMKTLFTSMNECLSLKEVSSLQALKHPYIVQLVEANLENSELNLVYEFLDCNVYEVMQNTGKAFAQDKAKKITHQLLQALGYIHGQGYMHRDVKPDNMLIAGEDCKLADFGLCREISNFGPLTDYVSTRWYRSPEILLKVPQYGPAADIFAAGCVMAELFLMRPLFPGANEIDQLNKLCSVLGTPDSSWDQYASRVGYSFPKYVSTPMGSLLPGVNPLAVDLISKMISWNPQDRPTADQCMQHAFFRGEVAAAAPRAAASRRGQRIISKPGTENAGYVPSVRSDPSSFTGGYGMNNEGPASSFGGMDQGNFGRPPVMNPNSQMPVQQTSQPSGVISSGPVRRELPTSNKFALGRQANPAAAAPQHDFSNSTLFNKDALDNILGTGSAPEKSPFEVSPVKVMFPNESNPMSAINQAPRGVSNFQDLSSRPTPDQMPTPGQNFSGFNSLQNIDPGPTNPIAAPPFGSTSVPQKPTPQVSPPAQSSFQPYGQKSTNPAPPSNIGMGRHKY